MANEQLDPMKELNRLRNTVGKVIEQGINTVQGAVQSATAIAAVRLDVYELNNEVVIRTNALDGLVAESIEVAMEGAELTIKGFTEAEEIPENASYFLQERKFGAFERTVTIPIPVKSEEAKAKLGKNGVLTVTLPIDKGKYQDIAVTPDE